MKKLWEKYGDIIRYLIVGGLTTLVSLAAYFISVELFLDPEDPFQLQVANVLSWIAAVIFAYVANRLFVFRSKDPHWVKEVAKFITSRVGTLLLEMALMFIGVTVLKFNDKVMKLIVQFIVMAGNYIFSKLFVFKKRNTQQADKKESEELKESEE